MKKKILSLALAITCSSVFAGSIDKAVMLSEHGLIAEAKSELIDVIFEKTSKNNKSRAYYLLGNIAFEQNKIAPALKAWKELVLKYPKSKEATLVKDKINQLSEIIGEGARETVDNAIAASYLRIADFWSSDRSQRFTIDTSWMPKVEIAVKWYDKVIAEFPNTIASKVAYEDKMRTLLGWKERGKYGSSFGVKNDFKTYMPMVLKTFSKFEKEHLDVPSLQAFRYQIAQTYWSKKDWKNTRLWLNLIIEKSGDKDSFYKDTAQRRLQKLEY